jgi:hypothetical protein
VRPLGWSHRADSGSATVRPHDGSRDERSACATNGDGTPSGDALSGASGLALLSALGPADAVANGSSKRGGQRSKTRRGKGKRQSAGASTQNQTVQSNAAGTQGGVVQSEQRRHRFTTRKVIGGTSAQLSTTVGSGATSFADCGGDGKALSCGYETTGAGEQLLNVFVSSVAPDPERSRCESMMQRTAGSGSVAGAVIRAVAVCRV